MAASWRVGLVVGRVGPSAPWPRMIGFGRRARATMTRLSARARTVSAVFRSPDEILAALDPEQREVASTLRGPVAVIAGAGTGKTRAITHRIAYGVATGVYRPTSVLAVTFTTRAAGELRGRLQRLGV